MPFVRYLLSNALPHAVWAAAFVGSWILYSAIFSALTIGDPLHGAVVAATLVVATLFVTYPVSLLFGLPVNVFIATLIWFAWDRVPRPRLVSAAVSTIIWDVAGLVWFALQREPTEAEIFAGMRPPDLAL